MTWVLGYSARVIRHGRASEHQKDLQDESHPYYGLALFKVDFVAVEACACSDEHACPTKPETDVGVCVYLLEEVWPREELD